ncbi:hypothetical protein ABFS82_13G059000 [Erythranthe guttata]|uniref:VQ domain-containing protein n=1 Tax=Erythranthe guttata TaxID=4155 RepID=A0A022QIX2_ERYGU|nr:PREDICTED: VQ motif-containing protein 10-like [Erythranthe guttata]EYU27228.1 hypothetical protein MIMGU_mgv1a023115mg [Erythranthe guttata]|eukprot:XP_012849545.1 PREDICTED: VQ motif-containing protein 10-like [Erythranthe guttata]
MGGGGMMKREQLLPVKVVIINTEYVETDAESFKSVVQRLTGKHSTLAAAAAAEEEEKLKPPRSSGAFDNYYRETTTSGVLERGLSFKDFDRMLKELPSLDELYTIYAE